MTNREAIQAIVNRLFDTEIEALHVEAETVVGMAQNGPPDGEADGTLDEQRWYRARDVSNALTWLWRAIDAWESAERGAGTP